eukprot:6731019-Pyramimonas_sp.AAC.1
MGGSAGADAGPLLPVPEHVEGRGPGAGGAGRGARVPPARGGQRAPQREERRAGHCRVHGARERDD